MSGAVFLSEIVPLQWGRGRKGRWELSVGLSREELCTRCQVEPSARNASCFSNARVAIPGNLRKGSAFALGRINGREVESVSQTSILRGGIHCNPNLGMLERLGDEGYLPVFQARGASWGTVGNGEGSGGNRESSGIAVDTKYESSLMSGKCPELGRGTMVILSVTTVISKRNICT